jgi:histidine triad (HIT) family protein
MEPSIFAKIIDGDIPCHRVYEDDQTLAFLDINPIVPGHTLVVPKVQVDQFQELDDEAYAALWRSVKIVARRLKQKLGVDRVALQVYGIDVPHAHVLVLPFNVGDDLSLTHILPEDERTPEALQAMAAKVALL